MGSFYLYYILSVMLVFPLILTVQESYSGGHILSFREMSEILFKWFIFWGIGIRCLTAGLSQVMNPGFTASLLQLDSAGFVVIRELGFANISMGLLGLLSLPLSRWRPAAAFCGGLFLGKAGILHLCRIPEGINPNETAAMVSDLFILAAAASYLILAFLRYRGRCLRRAG